MPNEGGRRQRRRRQRPLSTSDGMLPSLTSPAVVRWRRRRRIQSVVSIFFLATLVVLTSFMSTSSSTAAWHCHAFASPSPWNSPLYNQVGRSRIWRPATANGDMSTTTTTETTLETTSLDTTTTETELATTATNVNGDGEGVEEEVNLTTSEVLSLDSIRASLIRQEETIIFALIERAQFRQNLIVYAPGGMGPLGTPPGSKKPSTTDDDDDVDGDEALSFLEYMLLGTEALHYLVRRYMSPQEHAFFPDRLPTHKKLLRDLEFPSLLSDVGGASDVNFNQILLKKYIDTVVPAICQPGDDEQHGSTALCDVALLQALSKRVHYGKFVAESKYLGDPEGYRRLVEAGDAAGVMALLTNEAVEAKVLRRSRLKAATYGTEPLLADLPPLDGERERTSIVAAAAASAVVAAIEAMGEYGNGQTSSSSSSSSQYRMNNKVCPATVETIYRDLIIPLTKDIEVAYLFRRCGREPPPEFAPHRMSTDDDAE